MPKKTFQAAKDQDVGLTVALKANQGHLLREARENFEHFKPEPFQTLSKEKGAVVEKSYRSLRFEGRNFCASRAWTGLIQSVIQVERKRHLKSGIQTEVQLYVSNRVLSAAEAEKIIRGHWLVEGKFHQQLDRCLGEDGQRKSGYAKALGLMSALVHNLLRRNYKSGWKREMYKNAMDFKRVAALRGLFVSLEPLT